MKIIQQFNYCNFIHLPADFILHLTRKASALFASAQYLLCLELLTNGTDVLLILRMNVLLLLSANVKKQTHGISILQLKL